MKKNYVQNVIVHITDGTDLHTLTDKVSEYHADIIESKLAQSDLTREQKIAVIDKIMENLKLREVDGIIK